MKRIISVVVLLMCLLPLCGQAENLASSKQFVTIRNGQFIKDARPYYYVGANFWYGAILGSEGTGGNRKRLCQELDSLSSIGITNLRVLVGADGKSGVRTKVEPTLQLTPGIYNDTILAGLDFLLKEMGQRGMKAVLYLNNSWEWSGGYSQYLEWAGEGKAPIPAVDGWQAFFEHVKKFPRSAKAKALFAKHVTYILKRRNRYTGLKYVDDPAIMSWQIGNEPRAFSDENKEPFAQWIAETAKQIKSLDKKHLVSVGSEGAWGCENDYQLYERLHADKNIDYLTVHIWPYNWGWAKKESLKEDLPNAIAKTDEYIDAHLAIAKKYQKPMVVEEFGYPRDGFTFGKESTTNARNAYYEHIFSRIKESAKSAGMFAGCNFWAWGGMAKLSDKHVFWEKGDDYTGDPAQEEQGLNSVFTSDRSTLELVKQTNASF